MPINVDETQQVHVLYMELKKIQLKMSKPEKSSMCTCYQIFYYNIIHASLLNTHDLKFDKEQ